MDGKLTAILLTVAFSLLGVSGDYFLKRASEQDSPLATGWFWVGFLIYSSTAFCWAFVMRHLKLATIGIVYSVSMILLLTAIGVLFFGEKLNLYEVAGIAMALGSLILLMRFA